MMGWFTSKIKKTPLFFQMEGVECGAASLGMILGYFGAYYPLRELREACFVSRDGVKASTILDAAKTFGLEGKGQKIESMDVFFQGDRFPCIVFWKFYHFLVVEGATKSWVYLNDPAIGRYRVTKEVFDKGFTGVVLTFAPGEHFVKKSQASSWISRLGFWFKGYRKALWYLVMVGLGLIVPALMIPALMETFVDHYLIGGAVDWRLGIIVAFGLMLVGQMVMMGLMKYFMFRLERAMTVRYSGLFVRTLMRLPMTFFSQRFVGDLAYRVGLPERISAGLGMVVVGFSIQLLSTFFYLALMAAYDLRLMAVTFVLGVFSMWALWYSIRTSRADLYHIGMENARKHELNLTGLSAIHTLQATGRGTEFFQKWLGQNVSLISRHQTLALSNERLDILPVVIQGVVQLFIFGVGGFLAIKGEISLGRLVAFQTIALAFFKPITDLLFSINQFQQLGIELARSEDVLHQPEATMGASPSLKPIVPLIGHLSLKNVTFGYQRREAPLLTGFNLEISVGARIAIVGGSGSGKSTVAKLIAGLYTPWSGEILIDGMSLLSLDPAIRSRMIGVVDQEMVFFEGSIRDNITLWDPTISDEDVIRAAKDAELHYDISHREGGYDADLMSGGKSLSGGQRQRLEIARVLARNPQILIMDEATSALDPLVELAVDQHIRRRACSVIVIAHRLSTIRDADQIVVLDRGEVMGVGTHNELMTLPYYAQLVRTE